MANFPLGGQGKDYDSKKSRGNVLNLYPEGSKDGYYRSVRRAEGLSSFAEIGADPVRSDLLVNAGFIYLVAGDSLYRVNNVATVTSLGAVGGTGRAVLKANSVPGDSQILILNGSGAGYIYTNANGLVQITDPDFFSSTSATILNERFWLVRDGTNEFFGSDVSDGTAYNPLTFASAEESPDNMVATIAKKSALWNIGEYTTEYWQSFDDITLPLRKVKGASKQWGIIAKNSIAETNDFFAFFASDRTVRMVRGTQLVEISDLDFKLRVKGNGTATFPGFTTIDDAIGFFVDGPVHSIYYLTFPTEGYTWGYDLNTGLPHERKSEGFNRWRVNSSAKFNGKIICGDSRRGVLWILDQNATQEDGNIQRTELTTSFVSFEKDVTVPLIELDMEVAKTTDPEADPKMIVKFTKDGGYNWTTWGTISLGGYGEHDSRVPLRLFGKVKKNKDFGLKLITTDPVGVQYYGAHIYPREDF
jgi:hypothetical protein